MWWASVSCVFHIWKVVRIVYISGQVSRRRWFFDFLSSTNKKNFWNSWANECFSIHTNREDFWHRYEKLPRKRGKQLPSSNRYHRSKGSWSKVQFHLNTFPRLDDLKYSPTSNYNLRSNSWKSRPFRFPGDSWARAIKRCKNRAFSNS